MINLLLGIVLATLLFAALLWSIFRAVRTTRYVRANQISLILFTLAGMASATWNLSATAAICGIGCIFTGIVAMRYDSRWSRLLPLVQVAFGCVLLYALFVTAT